MKENKVYAINLIEGKKRKNSKRQKIMSQTNTNGEKMNVMIDKASHRGSLTQLSWLDKTARKTVEIQMDNLNTTGFN